MASSQQTSRLAGSAPRSTMVSLCFLAYVLGYSRPVTPSPIWLCLVYAICTGVHGPIAPLYMAIATPLGSLDTRPSVYFANTYHSITHRDPTSCPFAHKPTLTMSLESTGSRGMLDNGTLTCFAPSAASPVEEVSRTCRECAYRAVASLLLL